MEYPVFLCIFQKNSAMAILATLGLKKMGKYLWAGREKSLPSWLSQFSFAKDSYSKVHWENSKKKSGIMKSGLGTMRLFLLDDLLKEDKKNYLIRKRS